MNRLVFIMLVLLGWVGSAQGAIDNPAAVFSGDRVFVIPGTLSSDGKANIYVQGDADRENGTQEFSLYDDEFNLLNEFSVQLPWSTYQRFAQKKVYTPTVKTGEYKIDERWTMDDAEEFTQDYPTAEALCDAFNSVAWDEDDMAKIVTLENGKEAVAYIFWMKDKYGDTYPSMFYMKNDQNLWWRYTCEYELVSESWTWGDKEEVENYSGYDYLVETHLLYNGEGSGNIADDADYGNYLVRGVFGDNVTYVKPILEERTFEEDGGEWKYITTQSVITGYEVVDINGKHVTSIQLPKDVYGDDEIAYLSLSGKKYILTYTHTREGYNSNYYLMVYLLDSKSQAKQIVVTSIGKVVPRDPRKGETVTVTVDDKYSNQACTVNVVSAEGRTMLTRSIAPGETSIQFNTDAFPQGVYVVTFSGKSGKSEAAKIIVR